MNRDILIVVASLALLLGACGKPVDKVELPADSSYLGTWIHHHESAAEGASMLLVFYPDSTAVYRRCSHGGNGSHSRTAVDASHVSKLTDRQLQLRVGMSRLGFNMNFKIQARPHETADGWEMTVDGLSLKRMPEGSIGPADWPCPGKVEARERKTPELPADKGVSI